MNDQDQHPRQSASPSSTHNIPKRELGCLCLEPRRHAGDRPFNHGSQVECITLFSPYSLEKASVCLRVTQCYSGRSPQIAGFRIHQGRILSDWLANVVMVKKANGKWWMCVDFMDLNKAYPKDSYPFSRIDVLVDSTTRSMMVYCDSQVIMSQVNGDYKCKGERMKKYLKQVRKWVGDNLQAKTINNKQ